MSLPIRTQRRRLHPSSTLPGLRVAIFAVVAVMATFVPAAGAIPPQPPDQPTQGFCSNGVCNHHGTATASPRMIHPG